jgi:hypothetical protein
MRRMNNSRVNFQAPWEHPVGHRLGAVPRRRHHIPHRTDATQPVLAADFLSLDMTDLLTQPGALALLRAAEQHAGRSDYTEALALLSEGFADQLSDYASRKRTASGSAGVR